MGARASWGMLTTEHRRWCQPAGPTPGSGPVCGSAWLGVASEPGHLLRLGVPRESALLSPAESVSPGSREHLQRKAPYPAAPSLLPCPPLGCPRGMRVPGLLFLLDPRRNSGSQPTTQCSAEACSCASEVALAHLTSPATLAPRLSGLLALSSTPSRPAPRRGGGASRTARLRQQRQGGAPGLGLVPVQNCEDTGTRAQNLHGGDTAGFRGGGMGGGVAAAHSSGRRGLGALGCPRERAPTLTVSMMLGRTLSRHENSLSDLPGLKAQGRGGGE